MFLYELHSGVRWIVTLATVIALVWMIVALVSNRPYDKITRIIMSAFGGLVGLQWIIGIVLIVVMGVYTSYQLEHAVTMTLALVAAHGYVPFKKRPDRTRLVINIVCIALTLALVFVGVARLPQGWLG
jgi:hypothetical protein